MYETPSSFWNNQTGTSVYGLIKVTEHLVAFHSALILYHVSASIRHSSITWNCAIILTLHWCRSCLLLWGWCWKNMQVRISVQTVRCTCARGYTTWTWRAFNVWKSKSSAWNDAWRQQAASFMQQASCSNLTHLIGAVMWSRVLRLRMWSTNQFLEERWKFMRSAERWQREIRSTCRQTQICCGCFILHCREVVKMKEEK